MQDCESYLKVEELKDHYCYKIYARNACVGIWDSGRKGFWISRYKVNTKPRLDFESHWDEGSVDYEEYKETGVPGGTAKPIKIIKRCPIEIKENGNYSDLEKQALLEYLDKLDEDTWAKKERAVIYQKRLSGVRTDMSAVKMKGFEHNYKIHKDLEFLEPVFYEWLYMNKLIRQKTGSNYNWFSEKSNLSVVIASISRCSGIAIEEFSVASKKGNRNRSGADLFFNLKDQNILCEAKHGWLQLPSYNNKEKDFKFEIENDKNLSLENADGDILNTLTSVKKENRHHIDFGLALTFFTPYWNGENKPQHQIEKLKKDLEELFEESRCHFYSYVEGAELIQGTSGEKFSSILMIGRRHFV